MEINALEIFNKVYPVGSIYLSVNSTNPSSYFGGTWVAWGSGRVPIGVNTSDTSFNTVEKTGGAKTVSIAHTHKVTGNSGSTTLTINQIPKHAHNIRRTGLSGSPGYGGFYQTTGDPEPFDTEDTGGGQGHNHSINLTSASGGSSSVSNLQPYITCYMWKRTA